MSLASSDFQANLGKIIHDIYLTGHHMFRDMPPGKYIAVLIHNGRKGCSRA